MKQLTLIMVCLTLLMTCGCSSNWPTAASSNLNPEEDSMEIQVTSTAFDNGEMIPEKYTCDGENISPPLAWKNIPTGTVSIALISTDPDAPMGTWTHWVIYNLPSPTQELKEGIPNEMSVGNGGIQGKNSSDKIGYQGPCPPSGTHRYYFRVYALDTMLDLEPGANRQEVEEAMKGHIIAQGELMGKYSKK